MKKCFERLEERTLFATIAGTVWIDHNSSSQVDAADQPVPSVMLWIDSNQDGFMGFGEPQTHSDASGEYVFTGLPVGEYEIRMRPTPGLFQTSPARYTAMYREGTGATGLAEIDLATGAVTQLTPAVGQLQFGLVKTIQGEFYGTDFVTDTLYRIDPVTGLQFTVGQTAIGIVGGLTYDPIMDRIYTLGHADGDFQSPLVLYEVNRHNAELTRVGTGEGPTGVRSTSAVTFDLVNREVVLFDNNLNEVLAYDLNGNGRKLSQFPTAVAFYNLAFDGHRFLTFRSGPEGISLRELDIHHATLTPVLTLDKPLSAEAAEILAVNQAQRIRLDADDSEVLGVDFLTNKMNITHGSLLIDDTDFRLFSVEKGLDVGVVLEDETAPALFCFGQLASEIFIEQLSATKRPIEVQTSPLDDRVFVTASPTIHLNMGAGRDTLGPTAPMVLDLGELSDWLTSVEIIDLRHPTVATLLVDAESIKAISGAQGLYVLSSTEDVVDLTLEEWTAARPTLTSANRLHHLSVDEVIMDLEDGFGWKNPLQPADVNRDGLVSAIDALLIVNLLNAGSRELSVADPLAAQAEYVDTNGDNFLSAIDALLVINLLNQRN